MTAHARLGIVIFALLACNTVYYVVAGRFSEALESVAWYVLLILFVIETGNRRLSHSAIARVVLRGLRLLAALRARKRMAGCHQRAAVARGGCPVGI
jgi:hypothetical protein